MYRHTDVHTEHLFYIIGLMSGVFANGLGDQGSIPGRVIPKTQKMVLYATLLNIQHYKVRIEGKVEQSREWSSTLPYTSMYSLLKKEPLSHPWQWLPTLLIYILLPRFKM